MTGPTSESESALREKDRDSLAMYRHNFTELELVACAHLVPTPRSRLSILPPTDAAEGRDLEPSWEVLEQEGVIGPGTKHLLTGFWEFAFDKLAASKNRWRLYLGTPEWVERTEFHAAGRLKNSELVLAVPSDEGCQISFPASPEDAIDLVLDHLDVKALREGTGFREQLSLAEYATLLAVACSGDTALSAATLLETCSCSAESGEGVSTLTWGGAIAPWPIELDSTTAAQALSSLRKRALLYSLDGAEYGALPDADPLLRALAGMRRYAAVDFETELLNGNIKRVSFAVIYGDSSLWLAEFSHDSNGEPSVILESIELLHFRLAMEKLIDLSWISEEESMDEIDTVDGEEVLNYEFSEEELALLLKASSIIAGESSPLAALKPRGAPHQEAARGTLEQRKLFDGATIEPRLAQAVRALAQPSITLAEIGGVLPSLNVSRRFVTVDEQSAYAVGHGSRGPDSHALRFPLPPDELFPITESLLLSDRGGGVAPFTALLEPSEYAALITLVDLYRAEALKRTLNREAGFQLAITGHLLAESFRAGMDGEDHRWLVTLLRDISPVPLELDQQAIPQIFSGLVQKGLLQSKGGQACELTEDCAAFCHMLMQVEAAVGIAVVVQNRPGTRPIALTAFWSMGMIWLADYGSDEAGKPRISIQTALPAELRLGLVSAYAMACNDARGLTQPSGVETAIVSPEPVQTQPVIGEAKRCPECDAAVPLESLFCLRCGADLRVKQTKVCPACRNQIPDITAAFCPSCGNRLGMEKPQASTITPPSAERQPVPPAPKASAVTPPAPKSELPIPPAPKPTKCGQCGTTIKPGRKFCSGCGAAIDV